ncbi:MAG: hypothetical protein R3F40_12180 [Candidatus Competibacteraceae bacterium]
MPNENAPLNPQVLDRSRAVIRQPVELATHLGLKLYNRTFPRVEAALYLAEVIVHLQGRASRDYAEEIAQVNTAIARELDRLSAFADHEARQLGKLAVDASGAAPAIQYTQAIRLDLTLRTPRARRYAVLLAELEQISRDLDKAWYNDALETPQRLERERRLFRNVMRGCGVVERLARGLARRVRDDSETPDYRDMLIKRTGRGPDADPAPAVIAEDAADMTVAEAASLQATEAMARALSSAPAAADETSPPSARSAAATERVETAPAAAGRTRSVWMPPRRPRRPQRTQRWRGRVRSAPMARKRHRRNPKRNPRGRHAAGFGIWHMAGVPHEQTRHLCL